MQARLIMIKKTIIPLINGYLAGCTHVGFRFLIMVLFLGTFILNALCAIVPCYPTYESPVPSYHQRYRYPPPAPPDSFTSTRSSPFSTRSVHNGGQQHPSEVIVVHRNNHKKQEPPQASPSISASSIAPSSSTVIKVKIPILKSPYVVSTQSGKVEGFSMKTIRSRDIIAFIGIPYAEPPVGNLRYRVKSIIVVFF